MFQTNTAGNHNPYEDNRRITTRKICAFKNCPLESNPTTIPKKLVGRDVFYDLPLDVRENCILEPIMTYEKYKIVYDTLVPELDNFIYLIMLIINNVDDINRDWEKIASVYMNEGLTEKKIVQIQTGSEKLNKLIAEMVQLLLNNIPED